MKWEEYHKKRTAEFLKERKVRSIRLFTDDEKIALAEANATCYHPKEKDGWDTRIWLESINCVHHRGCCTGCKCKELCLRLSSVYEVRGR